MDYGYANARIRAMKSRLLERNELEELAAKLDVDAVINQLQETPYREDIADASVKHSGKACVEDALRRNLGKTFRLLLSYVSGGDGQTLMHIFLNKWDIQNIKTILRGKNINEAADEIAESFTPAGALDDATLVELTKQPDVRAVIDLLATWEIEYSRPLTQHFKEYIKEKDLLVLEYALDKFYYDNALAVVAGGSYDKGIIREMLTAEIDVTNIKSILRIIRDKVEPEDPHYYFIRGGKELNAAKLSALSATRSIDGVIKQLTSTSYDFLAKVPDEYVKMEKISAFEKELNTFLLHKALRLWTADPLSIALAIAYLWAKFNEIANIRIIAMCKTEYVPEAELMEELVFV